MAGPGFSSVVGTNSYIFLAENSMKVKEFGPGGQIPGTTP